MSDAAALPAPTQDEQTMALLAHILQLFTWWIGPLVIYIARRESKFVAFHAMQALLWQIIHSVLFIAAFIAWFAAVLLVLIPHAPHASHTPASQPPIAFFVGFGFFWLAIMIVAILNIVIGIYFGIKASRGEWASYPLIGRWARSIVGV
jgi:uncharacterized Tic20 family protein